MTLKRPSSPTNWSASLVEALQQAAAESQSYFEPEPLPHLEPEQFAFHLLTQRTTQL
jgi:hypothetical protein